MNDTVDIQARLDQLAILACDFSGYNPFHKVDDQPLYKSERAQERARKVLATLMGAGELPLLNTAL